MAAARNVSAAARMIGPAFAGVAARELADRRGLAGAVDADDEHDRGAAARPPSAGSSRGRAGRSRAANSARMAASGPPGSRRRRARSTRSIARAAPTSPAISVSSTSSHDGPSPVPVPRNVAKPRHEAAPRPLEAMFERRL